MNEVIVEEWDILVLYYFMGDDVFSLIENVMKFYVKRGILEE